MQAGEAALGARIQNSHAGSTSSQALLARPINLLSLLPVKDGIRLAVGALPGSGHPRVPGLALQEIVACPGRIRQEADTIIFLFQPCYTKYCPLHICAAV